MERGDDIDGRCGGEQRVAFCGCVQREAEGEDEGVVELDALDVEFVEEVVGLGRREVVDASVLEFMDEVVEGAKGDAQGRGGEFGLGGIEEALSFGDLLVDFFERGTERVGECGGDGGDAGEGGVDAVEEAGFEAGVVAVGLVEFRAVAVVADVEAAAAAASGWTAAASAHLAAVQTAAFAAELRIGFAAEERVGIAFGNGDVSLGYGVRNFSSYIIGEAGRDVLAGGGVVHALVVDAAEGG